MARTRQLRGYPAAECKVAAVVAELEHELARSAPVALVADESAHPQSAYVTRDVALALSARASTAGLEVLRWSLSDAAVRITGSPSLRGAVLSVIERYAPLAERLAPDGRLRVRDPDRWREARPLAGAFCLAHAAALDIVTTAARGPGDGPPPSPPCS